MDPCRLQQFCPLCLTHGSHAGGRGTRAEIKNDALVSWVRDVKAQHKLSVCTGAALLAVAGLLQGRRATTNKLAFDWVASLTAAVHTPGCLCAECQMLLCQLQMRHMRRALGGTRFPCCCSVSCRKCFERPRQAVALGVLLLQLCLIS